jgi:NAD(P)-dependent dehydrogenase (short-subunit alcohol dehydrogenase family)
MGFAVADEAPCVLVTGATNGLGRGVARALAHRGWRVLVHGRDEQRLRRTTEWIRRSTGNDLVCSVAADFARLRAVEDASRVLRNGHPKPDVLVNNAGIGTYQPGAGQRRVSADGYELRFAVNYLAAFWLTERLRAVDANMGLVNVVSGALHPLDLGDLMTTRGYSGSTAYGRSKLALVVHARQQAAEGGGRAGCVNPGWYLPTGMHRPGRPVRDDVASGVRRILTAVDGVLDGETEPRFQAFGSPMPIPVEVDDAGLQRALRIASLDLVHAALNR